MKCKQARLQLNRGEQGLPLSAHLVLCGRCRAEARTLQDLQQAVCQAGRFTPPPTLLPRLLAVTQSTVSVPINTKPGEKMITSTAKKRINRRLHWVVYLIVAALIASGLAVAFLALPKKSVVKPKPVSNSVIPKGTQNAQQMVHIVMPIEGGSVTQEIWSSPDKVYFRASKAKELLAAIIGGIDLAGNKEWVYESEKETLFEADLTPVAAQAADIIARSHQFILDPEKVKKFDPKFASASYDYTTPVPPELDSFQPPAGTRMVQATAKIEKTDKQLSLVMEAEGGVVMRSDVPLDK